MSATNLGQSTSPTSINLGAVQNKGMTRWSPGDPVASKKLNEPIAAIEALSNQGARPTQAPGKISPINVYRAKTASDDTDHTVDVVLINDAGEEVSAVATVKIPDFIIEISVGDLLTDANNSKIQGLQMLFPVVGSRIINLLYTGVVVGDTVGAITCSNIAGTVTDIVVALPWLLRKASFDGKTINGIIYTWTSTFVRNADPAPAGGGDDFDANIHMPYVVGDVISAVVNGGKISDISDVATYPYVELPNNRIWGRTC